MPKRSTIEPPHLIGDFFNRIGQRRPSRPLRGTAALPRSADIAGGTSPAIRTGGGAVSLRGFCYHCAWTIGTADLGDARPSCSP
jgi:hypothetical protein